MAEFIAAGDEYIRNLTEGDAQFTQVRDMREALVTAVAGFGFSPFDGGLPIALRSLAVEIDASQAAARQQTDDDDVL